MEPNKITELYAWVCTEPDGGEGIPAANLGGMPMPLVGADKARIESLRPYAEDVAYQLGLPVKLVRFTNMEVLEHLNTDTKGTV